MYLIENNLIINIKYNEINNFTTHLNENYIYDYFAESSHHDKSSYALE